MIDATLSSFERDVIEASMEVPVLVDFWAPWCGPCKMLGPLLERLEREYGERFRLVNVNCDTNPELVSSFNLKSIPHSVAFVDGNAVAQFMGAQPEAFVRAFLDRLIPDPSKIEHHAAREALAKGQLDLAESYLKNAIALAYGMAMGSGLITRAPFASFHLYLVALLVSASPMTGAVAGLLFGLCRVLAVMPPVAMALYRGQGTLERARGVLAYAGVTHALNGLALAFVAAYLTCSIVTGVSR